ncbi:50S ribosomal protein L23 [Candidatus Woesebacteria bacterium CG_4_10_14_0_2_um_filter_44_9]|uniref:50S ribosomal protein L23 n=1 Tax=Candidatus Woesebacteria bacterium CG_4_10_14_0_2_um_filter_44_9 TaxID=1975055 RepID=A0A2M7TIV7_9BACT|nr:MAG: 50S ribosomal protein L23 [Candidatus Woesebacteria bacterium CG_4_10_14_0_2_um_filter_44_9]
MKLTPILTEKSLSLAKSGWYSFWVPTSLNKGRIKKAIGEVFAVHVKKVRSVNYRKRVAKNFRGRLVTKPASKKTLVSLAEGEKIEAFETKKEKKK